MAQINTPKAFDKSNLDSEILSKIEPFIEYTNQNFDQLIRALFNQITFGENIRGKFTQITVKHAQPITLDIREGVSGVLPYRVSGDAVKAYTLTTDLQGRPTVTFYFHGPIPIQTRTITVSSGIATAETNDPVTIGDTVSISQAGNAANNGDFLVIGKLTAPDRIVYYNSAAVAESRTTYLGVLEGAKSVNLFIFFA